MKNTISAELTLISSSGKTRVPARVQYDDDEDLAFPLSEISIIYNGAEYRGKGTDYLWVDTFADLQIKLPTGVKLACCMTCRHGNMCPYGNTPDRVFCMKGITADSKDALCDVFDTTDAYEKRAVSSCGICEDFVYQSDDYYTYNDFLHCLRMTTEYRSVKTPHDAADFLIKTNYLHDGYIIAAEYYNNGITPTDFGYNFNHELTQLKIRVVITSIRDAVLEMVFDNLIDWNLNNSQINIIMGDILEAAVFFNDDGQIVWTDDVSNKDNLKENSSYVIAQSMKWRLL